jgi:xanthine/uracil permease
MYIPDDNHSQSARYPHPSQTQITDTEAKRVKFVTLMIGIVLLIAFRSFVLADAIVLTLLVGYIAMLWCDAPSQRMSRRDLQLAKHMMNSKRSADTQ